MKQGTVRVGSYAEITLHSTHECEENRKRKLTGYYRQQHTKTGLDASVLTLLCLNQEKVS